MTWQPNSCKRCNGSTETLADHFGGYTRCLDCGWHGRYSNKGPGPLFHHLDYCGEDPLYFRAKIRFSDISGDQEAPLTFGGHYVRDKRVYWCPIVENNRTCSKIMSLRKVKRTRSDLFKTLSCPKDHTVDVWSMANEWR